MTFISKPEKENEFTEFFFNGLLKDVTAGTRNRVVSHIAGLTTPEVININTQYVLPNRSRPDVLIELTDASKIIIEVKIFPNAYREGQVIEHIAGVADKFGEAIYVFLDKNRVGTDTLTNELQKARSNVKGIRIRHADWYNIYSYLEEELGTCAPESRDRYLIQETLKRMSEEPLNMKPFMGLDKEQGKFLKNFRERKLRDFSSELFENSDLILNEIEYLLILKYDAQISTRIVDKPRNQGKDLIVFIEAFDKHRNLRPHIYSHWSNGSDEKGKCYHVFIELFKEEDDRGFVFPFDRIETLTRLFDGCDIGIECYDSNWATTADTRLNEWLANKNEIRDVTKYVYIGNYLNPEDFKNRGIIDEIFNLLSLYIDRLIRFIENES